MSTSLILSNNKVIGSCVALHYANQHLQSINIKLLDHIIYFLKSSSLWQPQIGCLLPSQQALHFLWSIFQSVHTLLPSESSSPRFQKHTKTTQKEAVGTWKAGNTIFLSCFRLTNIKYDDLISTSKPFWVHLMSW